MFRSERSLRQVFPKIISPRKKTSGIHAAASANIGTALCNEQRCFATLLTSSSNNSVSMVFYKLPSRFFCREMIPLSDPCKKVNITHYHLGQLNWPVSQINFRTFSHGVSPPVVKLISTAKVILRQPILCHNKGKGDLR